MTFDLLDFGVGSVTETDVALAESFSGAIYAFNVADAPADVRASADRAGVAIKPFNVIYKMVDELKDEISARLPPVEVEDVTGRANVQEEFMVGVQGGKKVGNA